MKGIEAMDNEKFSFVATAAFGLEGIVAAELRRLNMDNVVAMEGGAKFTATISGAFLACIRLRSADRVQMIMAEGECCTFEELFQLVKSVRWEKFISENGKINVSGKCVRSQLMSVRDCQAITKKAIIEELRHSRGQEFFSESGAPYPIDVAIHENATRVTLDFCGEALNRRGYRTWNGEAPLRETLAASLVELSTWRPGMRLHDPCCGTGTLLIEAAMRMGHRAPGLTRNFACEQFGFVHRAELDSVRNSCRMDTDLDRIRGISGSDIDSSALELAQRHVTQAGMNGKISLFQQDLRNLKMEETEGVFLCNPPYGERMSDRKSCENLYHEMGNLFRRHPGWSMCVITSDPMFERCFDRRADKKRRLYNGRLECEFMIFK